MTRLEKDLYEVVCETIERYSSGKSKVYGKESFREFMNRLRKAKHHAERVNPQLTEHFSWKLDEFNDILRRSIRA